MTTPNELDHVSHSQISLWDMCPRKWEFRYIQKLREPGSGNLILGGCYHDTLEAYFKAKLYHNQELDFDMLYDVFVTAWAKSVGNSWDIEWGKTTENAAKDMGLNLVSAYIDDVGPSIVPIMVEKTLDLKLENVSFTLRLDLINDVGAVIDHKTSARAYTQERIDKDMQASATAYALGKPIVFYNHVAIKSSAHRIQILKSFRTREDINWWISKATAIVYHMQSGIAPPHEDGWWCAPLYCGYYDACRGSLTGSYF